MTDPDALAAASTVTGHTVGCTCQRCDDEVNLAKASKSPADFLLVYRALMATYDSSIRVGHMTQFADEVAALAVSALAKDGRLLPTGHRYVNGDVLPVPNLAALQQDMEESA